MTSSNAPLHSPVVFIQELTSSNPTNNLHQPSLEENHKVSIRTYGKLAHYDPLNARATFVDPRPNTTNDNTSAMSEVVVDTEYVDPASISRVNSLYLIVGVLSLDDKDQGRELSSTMATHHSHSRSNNVNTNQQHHQNTNTTPKIKARIIRNVDGLDLRVLERSVHVLRKFQRGELGVIPGVSAGAHGDVLKEGTKVK